MTIGQEPNTPTTSQIPAASVPHRPAYVGDVGDQVEAELRRSGYAAIIPPDADLPELVCRILAVAMIDDFDSPSAAVAWMRRMASAAHTRNAREIARMVLAVYGEAKLCQLAGREEVRS